MRSGYFVCETIFTHLTISEWTVIQLCKELNPEVYEQSRDETIKYPSSIYMTLLRYPMSERFDHQPIKILLNRQDIGKVTKKRFSFLHEIFRFVLNTEELYETSHKYYVSLNGNNYAHNKVITEQQFEEVECERLTPAS